MQRVANDPEYRENSVYDSHPQKRRLLYSCVCNENILERVGSYKYLCIAITNDFCWDPHVNNIITKANAKLDFLRRYLRHASQVTKLQPYKMLIGSQLEYASEVWDPCTKKRKEKLERVHRLGLRLIFSIIVNLTRPLSYILELYPVNLLHWN